MKNWIISITLFTMLQFSREGLAQSYADQYKKGKAELKAKNYSQAMLCFRTCMVYDKENPYELYAHYYYALAAYHRGWYKIAKETLFALRKKNKWNQKDEVNYLLAHIFLAENEYFEVFKTLNKIKDPGFAGRKEALKKTTVDKITDSQTLEMLLEDYKEAVVADALLKTLNQPEQVNKRNDLIKQYHLTPPQPQPAVENKSGIRVVAMLPFLTNSLSPSPAPKKNQQVLDLYTGMRMAADTLKKNKVDIQLVAYDTRRDSVEVNRLLALDELKSADLLVGPLFKEGLRSIEEFAAAEGVPLVVNPMSTDGSVLQQPQTILFQPSFETIARRSAEFLAAHAKVKYCVVYYDEMANDSLKANAFITRADELGIKTLFKRKLNKKTGSEILTDLLTKKDSLTFLIKRDSIGGVYVASDDPLIFMKAINAVEARREATWVIGEESWFSNNHDLISKFSATKTAFASPNLINISTPRFNNFQQSFLKAHGKMPNPASCIGFEFMYTVGNTLSRDRHYFQKQEAAQPVRGRLSEGYQLQPSRDNGLVPFGRFKNGIFERVQKWEQ